MRHHNSVFHGLLQHIPWDVFDRLVEKHEADKHVRRLPTKSQFIALLYAQLSGAGSLRAVETGLKSHEARLYHLGACAVARSTLSHANRQRPWALFGELLNHLMTRATPGLRRKSRDAVRLMDATSVKLSGLSAGWAPLSNNSYSAKMHVVYDPDADCPLYCEVTTAKVADITAAKKMPIAAGATYVFDMGYYDFGWWAALDEAGCRFVTRLKKNSPFNPCAILPVSENDKNILRDRIGHLSERMTRNRRNPFQDPIREIIIKTDAGKKLRLVTNDIDAPAQEIAALYKRRWQIELFFKWIKQNLKIKHFLGASENAVRTQIATALIAFILLRMAQACQKMVKSPLQFMRLITQNLMHRRPINALLQPEPPPQVSKNQLNLALTPI